MIEEINNLDFDTQMKFWLHYIATNSVLKNSFGFYKVSSKKEVEKGDIHYPALGAVLSKHNFKIKVMSFEEFIDLETNTHKIDYGKPNGIQVNYTGIYDWYEKFKREIIN